MVQYSLGHCSLEVELKRPEMATAKGWSGKIHRKKKGANGLALQVGHVEGRKCPQHF